MEGRSGGPPPRGSAGTGGGGTGRRRLRLLFLPPALESRSSPLRSYFVFSVSCRYRALSRLARAEAAIYRHRGEAEGREGMGRGRGGQAPPPLGSAAAPAAGGDGGAPGERAGAGGGGGAGTEEASRRVTRRLRGGCGRGEPRPRREEDDALGDHSLPLPRALGFPAIVRLRARSPRKY